MAKNKNADNEKESVTEKTDNKVDIENKVIIGTLFSRLDHDKTLPYNNSFIKISPRQKIKKVNKALLSYPLPDGIIFSETQGG